MRRGRAQPTLRKPRPRDERVPTPVLDLPGLDLELGDGDILLGSTSATAVTAHRDNFLRLFGEAPR